MDYKKPFDLSGKVALVTGSSRGIGASIAHIFAAHGAQVIVSSRKIEGCEEVAQAIRKEGGKADAIACHIGELDAISALFAKIKEKHGRLDILVNNAATNPYYGPIMDTGIDAFQKTLDVNIRGYFYASVEGGRLMKEAGGGSIINVASVNAENPGMYQGIYSITKAAIVSMTKAFAKECAPDGIRVNALLPGPTETKFASPLFKDAKLVGQLMPHLPMKRIAEPDEMAGAALYLASSAASYTTGSCLTVDGGYLVG
nr:Enoyl-(Acyl carrier protein) reductase [uncultured bacterium]